MRRFLVERTFPAGTDATLGNGADEITHEIAERSADLGVNWIHSYVSDDRRKTFCVCDAPSPEAIRRSAAVNRLPIDRIRAVTVLNPYAYSYATNGDGSNGKER